jgi:hypothetical protein
MTPEEHQEKFNDRILAAIEKLTDTVADLEKHTVAVQGLASTVADHETRLKSIEQSMDFVKGAKAVFIALIIALIIGSAATVWQVVKGDPAMTHTDAAAIIKAIKDSKTSR